MKKKTKDKESNIISEVRLKKYYKKFKVSTLMDDMKFRMVCESKEVIEEILRVILNDNKLVVIEAIKQKEEDIPVFHGVRLMTRDLKVYLR